MASELIFVYGTLCKQITSPMHLHLIRYCEFFANGSLQGKLYDAGSYPGVVESHNPGDKVYGELYKIHQRDALFAVLDDYEGCTADFPEPHEYCRKKLTIGLVSGYSIQAWVYVYKRNTSDLVHIKSGDYVKYITES